MAERAEPLVRVRGEVTLDVEPEIARLVVTIRAQDRNRRRTLDRLAERQRACRALIDRYGEAVEDVGASAVVITPELRGGRGERIRAYHGAVRLRVSVRDFTVLGELVTELGDAEMAAVEGPSWELRPGTEVYGRAAEQAMHAALTKARTYAHALGTEVTGLVEVADIGLSHNAVGYPPPVPVAYAAAEAAPPVLDLEPHPIQVHAAVEATFTLAPPPRL
nr:MAG: hypothetical protein DIU60_20600 [Actinomycetota bacterium]